MSKKKDVVVKEEAAVSTEVSATQTLGLTAEDVMIPKILLMQAISKAVEHEKARAGDFLHSLDEVVIGSKEEKPIEFLVIGLFKTLITMENGQYVKTEPLTAANARLPYEEAMSNGVLVNRRKSLNYYVLSTKDIDNMEPFPLVISFKGTSFKGGKKLGTKLLMLEEFGQEPYAKSFNLIAKKEENDKGSFYVLDIESGKKSTDEQKAISKRWAKRLESVNVQVHEGSEDESAAESTVEKPNVDNIAY